MKRLTLLFSIIIFYANTAYLDAAPSFAFDPYQLNFGDVTQGETSEELSFEIDASSLTENIALSVSGVFQMTLISGDYSGDTQNLVITQFGGSALATVYVRFLPEAEDPYSENISIASGATTEYVNVQGEGIASNAAKLIVSQTTFDLGNINVGETSSEQSFTVSGQNLTETLTIATSDLIELSLSSGIYGDNSHSLSIAQSGGAIPSTTVYFRFSPLVADTYNLVISMNTTGQFRDIAVVAVSNPKPEIVLNPTGISFGEVELELPSASKGFDIDASNLVDDLVVTASGNFEISLAQDDYSGDKTKITIPLEGVADKQLTVYVRFVPDAIRTVTDNVWVSSGDVSANVAVGGTGISSVPASIDVSSLEFDLGKFDALTTSSEQSFTVSGQKLDEGITIASSSDIELSLESGNYAGDNELNLPLIGSSVSETTVYFRVKALASIQPDNDISISASGVEKYVTVLAQHKSYPLMTTSANELSFERTKIGKKSIAKSISLDVTDLAEEILLTSTTGFEISLSELGFAENPYELRVPFTGSVYSTSVYVRYDATSVGAQTGELAIKSGETIKIIDLSGEGVLPTVVNIDKKPLVTIFPNPTNSDVTIRISAGSAYSSSGVLYNTLGVELKEVELNQLENHLSLAGLPVGVYWFKVTIHGQNKVIRIVKQ